VYEYSKLQKVNRKLTKFLKNIKFVHLHFFLYCKKFQQFSSGIIFFGG